MVTDAAGELADSISLTDKASKGRSGRVIPVNSLLLEALHKLLELRRNKAGSDVLQDRLILSQRSKEVSPQVIVNMFCDWYRELGFKGCSSHSGRRTFITNMAQKITVFQGSLRDVQTLAGHSSLGQTQRYIEPNERAKRAAVELI